MSSPYTATILEHFRHPHNFGTLHNADAAHEVLNPLCGDRIRVELAVRGSTIVEIRFRGDACAICIAAGSLMTDMIRGRPLVEAEAFAGAEILSALEAPLPEARLRCALLPLEALNGCLRSLPR